MIQNSACTSSRQIIHEKLFSSQLNIFQWYFVAISQKSMANQNYDRLHPRNIMEKMPKINILSHFS